MKIKNKTLYAENFNIRFHTALETNQFMTRDNTKKLYIKTGKRINIKLKHIIEFRTANIVFEVNM